MAIGNEQEYVSKGICHPRREKKNELHRCIHLRPVAVSRVATNQAVQSNTQVSSQFWRPGQGAGLTATPSWCQWPGNSSRPLPSSPEALSPRSRGAVCRYLTSRCLTLTRTSVIRFRAHPNAGEELLQIIHYILFWIRSHSEHLVRIPLGGDTSFGKPQTENTDAHQKEDG